MNAILSREQDATPATYRPLTAGMRWMLLTASVLVFLIGIPLTLLSTQTESYFSWTIPSALTAATLGGGYWASFALEFLAARERLWARARIAVPAVLIFTFLTLVVTLLHIDRFHFDSPAWHTRWGTWAWLLVYALVPVILAALLLCQRTVPGAEPAREDTLPAWARALLLLHAIVLFPLGVALFLLPTVAAPLWPWPLAPLVARAIGVWLLSIGILAAHAAWENEWQRIRSFSGFYAVLGVLQLVALLRYGGEAPWETLAPWLYVLFLLSILLLGVVGLRQTRWGDEPAPEAA